MKKIISLFIILLLITGCSSKEKIENGINYKGLIMQVTDVYYVEYLEVETNVYDKYLAVDLYLENTVNEIFTVNTITDFVMIDNYGNEYKPTIYENRISYKYYLEKYDNYNVTIVFPVKNAEYYTFIYNPGISDKAIFEYEISSDLKTQEPIYIDGHNKIFYEIFGLDNTNQ